jgi:hypothetical protein
LADDRSRLSGAPPGCHGTKPAAHVSSDAGLLSPWAPNQPYRSGHSGRIEGA